MLYDGWNIRHQYDLEHTRIIAAEIRNARMGVKQATKPEQIFNLPELDKRRSPQISQDSMDAFIKRMSEKEIKAGRLKPGQLIQLVKTQKE